MKWCSLGKKNVLRRWNWMGSRQELRRTTVYHVSWLTTNVSVVVHFRSFHCGQQMCKQEVHKWHLSLFAFVYRWCIVRQQAARCCSLESRSCLVFPYGILPPHLTFIPLVVWNGERAQTGQSGCYWICGFLVDLVWWSRDPSSDTNTNPLTCLGWQVQSYRG